MIAAVPAKEAEKAPKSLKESGENAWILGEIKKVGADGAQVTID